MIAAARVLLMVGALSLILSAPSAVGDEDDVSPGVMPTTNKQYVAECGACHFAYPPGLLPARSWEKLLSNLGNHFGESADLDAKTIAVLRDYLTKNAADRASSRISRHLARSVVHTTPLRITDTPFFKHEHREISPHWVKDNPKVQSFSRCQACHTRAADGSFSEGEINIPGHGRWD